MNFLVGEQVKTNLLYVRFWTTWIDGSLTEILLETKTTERLSLEQARIMLSDYVSDWPHYERRCFAADDITADWIGDVDLRGRVAQRCS